MSRGKLEISLTIHLVSKGNKMSKYGRIILVTLSILILIPFFSGCRTTIPPEALKLSPESLQQRQLQSRRFETNDEKKLLIACASLLQDTGFNLDESETQLGVIVGSKNRSAVNAGQVCGAIILAALTGSYVPTDKDQKMRACITTHPSGENKENIIVRVTFQRIVKNTQGQVTKREGIVDPEIYKVFFDKLSKAVFLEANNI